MNYQHTQSGKAILIILGLTALLMTVLLSHYAGGPIWLAFAFLGLVAICFCSLTIKVEDHKVKWFFGPKFWSKSIELEDIKSLKIVQKRWYYGLGIRITPQGWLYNVSGLTAVEIHLKNGTIISLGTDDAENLTQAIKYNTKHL